MLFMYIGSLLYGWGQSTKFEMAKALTEDKSLPKTTLNYIFQNYSASTQVAVWWMKQASLDAQLINTALCNRHCVLQSPKQRWAHMYIQSHQLLLTSAGLLTVHRRYAQMSLWEEKKKCSRTTLMACMTDKMTEKFTCDSSWLCIFKFCKR